MSDRSSLSRFVVRDRLATSDDPSNDRLVEVLDGYVAALERGDAEPVDAFVARYPELGDELAECLEGVRAIHAAVEVAREGADQAASPDDLTVDQIGSEEPPASADAVAETPRSLGGYDIVREIGRGGMGVVYEAQEQSLQRRVALKVLPFAAVLDQRQIARFRNEAQAAASLHHPHIVPVFAIGQERGVHFYAMQHIEGQSLSQAIAELRSTASGEADRRASPTATTVAGAEAAEGLSHSGRRTTTKPLPATTAASLRQHGRGSELYRAAARLAADAADALQHAHDQGVVHRDIKPSNLLIDELGKVWVTDFGLARMQSDLGVTATGDVVGTLRYMSPEQADGKADRVDGRTDVYALGATLYELLTLRHANRGDNRNALITYLQRGEPIAPRRLNPAVPADLENIVMRAMERDRDARYGSAAEFRDDLQRYLDGRPTVARPPNLAQRAGKWMRRRQRFVGVAAAALLIVAVVGASSAVLVERARQRAEAALAESETHRARAERMLEQARGVLDRLGPELSDRLAALPGSEPIRRQALEDTLDYYRYFIEESQGDPRLAASAAQTRVRAAAAAERIDQQDEALALYGEAERALSDLLADSPEDADLRDWLARCLNNRSLLLGDTAESRSQMGRAVRLRRALFDEAPESAARMADLAAALSDRAALAADESGEAEPLLLEAIDLLTRARRIEPDSPDHSRRLAITHNALASQRRVTKPTEARGASDRAVDLLHHLCVDTPEVDAYRADLAMVLSSRGALAGDRADWRVAAASYGAAAKELARLSRRNPLLPRHRSEQAVALASQAYALARAGQVRDSDEAFDDAKGVLASLVEDFPSQAKYRRSLAALWNNRGVVLRDAGRLAEAARAFATSVEIEEERLAEMAHPAPTLLAVHYANHAQVLGRLGRFDEAARVETKRIALLKENGEAGVESTGGTP